MKKKGFTPEQIITMLREAEVLLAQGSTAAAAARKLGITEQTYYLSEMQGHFKRIIEQGVAEGLFRRTDATHLSFAVLGMCNWMTRWYDADGRFSAEQIATFFSDTAMHMVRP